jgi:hypothetical protein
MDLATARLHIQGHLERMRALYFKPVFDEWMILAQGAAQGGVLAYVGPRADEFRQKLPAEVNPLLALVAGQNLEPGDFEFTNEGGGTRHDVLLKLGASSYLVANNTAKGMTEIRADPRWLKAQSAFFDLSEKFRADPLTV